MPINVTVMASPLRTCRKRPGYFASYFGNAGPGQHQAHEDERGQDHHDPVIHDGKYPVDLYTDGHEIQTSHGVKVKIRNIVMSSKEEARLG
nr:hypothetical protein [uncultured Desulfobacter sp.]